LGPGSSSDDVRPLSGRELSTVRTNQLLLTPAQDDERKRKFRAPRLVSDNQAVISMPDSTTITPAVDAVVFGSTAGFVLIFVVAQLIWSWKSGTLLRPRQARAIDNTNTATLDNAEDSQIQPASAVQPRVGSGNDLSRRHFKRILGEYYFEPMATELEPCSHPTTTTPGGRLRLETLRKQFALQGKPLALKPNCEA